MSICPRKELLWTFPNVVDVKMSKKAAFMDISGRGRCQNVLERSFYGNFRTWQMSKCLRKELLWTFPAVVDVKGLLLQ
jgi:hypothetical protein